VFRLELSVVEFTHEYQTELMDGRDIVALAEGAVFAIPLQGGRSIEFNQAGYSKSGSSTENAVDGTQRVAKAVLVPCCRQNLSPLFHIDCVIAAS
jgi:hypothetical protein